MHNKMTTEALIDRRLAEHQCDAGALAMIMLDIDNFKELNDSLGHVAGDRIIQVCPESAGGLCTRRSGRPHRRR